jgi:hypothetical protein
VLYFIVAIILTICESALFGTRLKLTVIGAVKRRANWFMVLVIGAWCEGIGLALRLGVRQNLHSTGLYIAQYLFVVLSVSHSQPQRDSGLHLSRVLSLPVRCFAEYAGRS